MQSPGLPGGPRTIRIGLTGLARAGKTALLTSLAANLLAQGSGVPALPVFGNRLLSARPAPAGASSLARFDAPRHLAALAADPPAWPERTDAVSLLALDLTLVRSGPLASLLGPRLLRLEVLDYPGEWLLDLPLLQQDFATWSAAVLARHTAHPLLAEFRAFVAALPPHAPADDAIAAAGHTLYATALRAMRDAGLSLLQPGRFLMPPPGPAPPWMQFFPHPSTGPLPALLRTRYEAYQAAVRASLSAPLFSSIDRLVVLADILTALHAGPDQYQDAAEALRQAAGALRFQTAWPDFLAFFSRLNLPAFLQPGGIRRVAYAASKADHVAERQRGNLSRLVAAIAGPSGPLPTASFAIAAMRCTEDFVWTLEGHPVSAVRGRVLGEDRLTRSYPGEVPDQPPDAAFWTHRFLALPAFEPMRLPGGGQLGVPNLNLDALLAFLLEDVL